ncbi:MAG: DEAD/DEAH box helicase, partial [Thermoleophilia bacterium]|nr:DEAD/DEAH box helicase [Thermoleophilia bacterium]
MLGALAVLGYEEPTPIQAETIPPLLAGRDLLGEAATGTGKTAAFALPLLQRISGEGERGVPRALVLVPTRELAMQVSEAIHRYGRGLGARVVPVFGGQPIGRQLRALEQGADVVVATPGRALDHLSRGTLHLDRLAVVVLDEADEMLDMGFAEDIDTILAGTPEGAQTVLFSATMPARIGAIARRHLTDPVRIRIAREQAVAGEAPLVRQSAYVLARAHKPAALARVLDVEAPAAAIVFCRTRIEVDQLADTLNGRGYSAEALHGGMTQEQRDRVMGRLRAGTSDLLIATDVAARGLDIDQLTHVVNYDVPSAPESYVHRIGRVGRAGREGVAITLAEPREHRMLKNIERLTGQRIQILKVPTVADLRARRLEMVQATVREAILQDDDLDGFRVVVETLTDEFDVMEVALAAMKVAHAALGGAAEDDEQDIPEAAPRDDRPARDRGEAAGRGKPRPRDRRPGGETTRLFIGAGRPENGRRGVPSGAVAGETRLTGRDVGAIEIFDRFS